MLNLGHLATNRRICGLQPHLQILPTPIPPPQAGALVAESGSPKVI